MQICAKRRKNVHAMCMCSDWAPVLHTTVDGWVGVLHGPNESSFFFGRIFRGRDAFCAFSKNVKKKQVLTMIGWRKKKPASAFLLESNRARQHEIFQTETFFCSMSVQRADNRSFEKTKLNSFSFFFFHSQLFLGKPHEWWSKNGGGKK